jgi:uncharacterized protein YndB with AHSA1/START domain
MHDTGTLKVTTPSDREIAMTRVFDAPRRLVFEALTTPALLKRWFSGPPGWTLAACDVDLRVGGAYRYVWRKDGGTEMGMGGVFLEILPPERIVATERFDQSWYPGDAVVTQTLAEEGGKTTLTLIVRYESKEARDGVLKSGASQGVQYGYDRLAEFLRSLEA